MKNGIFIISFLFIIPSLVGQDLSWLTGSWEGKGFQASANETWSVNLYADAQVNSYSIEYPSLKCGGVWEISNADFHKVEFVERIKHGKEKCIEGGTVVITYVDDQHVTFTYFSPGTRQVDAFSTLTRAR
jgi:hypothetical protein